MAKIDEIEKAKQLLSKYGYEAIRIVNRKLPKLNFETFYQELFKFHKKNGHCSVSPLDEKGKSSDLYKLCRRWRFQFRIFESRKTEMKHVKEKDTLLVPKNKSRLTEDQFEKLKKLGFGHSFQDAIWNRGYKKLKDFRDKYHHCCVTASHDKEFPGLRVWIQRQRPIYEGLRKKSIKEMSEQDRDKFTKFQRIGFMPTDSITALFQDPDLAKNFFKTHNYYYEKKDLSLEAIQEIHEKSDPLVEKIGGLNKIVVDLKKEYTHLEELKQQAQYKMRDAEYEHGEKLVKETFGEASKKEAQECQQKIDFWNRRITEFDKGLKHLEDEIIRMNRNIEEKSHEFNALSQEANL